MPLDGRYNNQFLFGLGLGFEYFVVTPNIVSVSGTSVGILVPQLKAGWRHMLTNSVGLDLALGFGITGEALATSDYLRGSGASSPPVEILAATRGGGWGL